MIQIEELYSLYKRCNGISTDTRTIKEGSMFFALKGETFDGNDFAVKALESGAKYAVVDRFTLEGTTYKGRKCIVVENALTALQQLAHHHRKQFDIPVIGITGTNGKTTTKELVAAVLKSEFNTIFTEANFNNFIGVPLTLFRIKEDTQIAVVEMGASAPGEITSLTEIVEPTHGIVTNVGKAHLEGFGSFDGVKKTKGELYDYLRQKGGTVFYNADNPYLCEMVNNRSGLVARPYGVKHQGASIVPPTVEAPFLALNLPSDIYSKTVTTKLVGDYNADNVMAALCIAGHFNVPVAQAVKAIESYTPSNNRSQFVHTETNNLIIDAYNANPSSMTVALDNFREIQFENKTLILGDMLELGEGSVIEHGEILKKALEITDSVYLVGEEFRKAAIAINVDGQVKCFADADQLAAHIQSNPLSSRTILIKGSHGTRLQSLPALL